MKKTYSIIGLPGVTKVSSRPLKFCTVVWGKQNPEPCVLAWHATKAAAEKFASPNRASDQFAAVSIRPVIGL
jgi:hypothetical protein